ncbi:MAG: hypothetical protein WC832_08480 [Anaerolineales bacterium]
MNLKTVYALFKRHQADLRQRGVKSLAVFGSLARGEATPPATLTCWWSSITRWDCSNSSA